MVENFVSVALIYRAGHVLRQEPFIQCEHRDGADANTRAMCCGLAGYGQMIHLPDMRELVFAAARRTRVPMRLHREARNQQAVDQSSQRFDVTSCDAVGSREPYFDIVLHQCECRLVEWFLADGIGQYP